MREWKARQEAAIQEKRIAEERELKHIHEEAQAERELLYSQREKQIAAAKKANREREVVMEASRGEGWEAVLNLISDENLVKDKNTDLGRFKRRRATREKTSSTQPRRQPDDAERRDETM